MTEIVAIVVGSALGGMARFWVGETVARHLGERFPWGTLIVNVSGALAIGLLAGLLAGGPGASIDGGAWHFAGLGLVGSYTTVSSFSLQTLALAHDGRWGRVAANIMLSVGLCLPAVALGLVFGIGLTGSPA